ncbi:MAG: hypothetical protein R2708_24060 [Vicinamibacterales bacterium]
MPSLVVYRVIYYLLPLTVATTALVADEVHHQRAHVVRAGVWLGALSPSS